MNATNVKVHRNEETWEVEVQAEIPAESLDKHRAEALLDIQRTAKIDGFRPGKAPIERIVQIYGEATVMRHAAELAIKHELPEILAKENVLVIESPRVSTDTPVAGQPLPFTAHAPLPPKVELPDYKAIAKKQNENKEDTTVSDEEQAQTLSHLQRERMRIDKIEAGVDTQQAAAESRDAQDADLPALDDAFVQSLGYENTEAFIAALRKNIQNEKELRATEKRRGALLDQLVEKSTVHYPASLREYEIDDMEARLKDDLTKIGQTFETYLAQIKKTHTEVRAGWNDAADKRVKVRLILGEIARKENIQPDADALKHEMEQASGRYAQADPEALRSYIAHALRNEATLRFLENTT